MSITGCIRQGTEAWPWLINGVSCIHDLTTTLLLLGLRFLLLGFGLLLALGPPELGFDAFLTLSAVPPPAEFGFRAAALPVPHAVAGFRFAVRPAALLSPRGLRGPVAAIAHFWRQLELLVAAVQLQGPRT